MPQDRRTAGTAVLTSSASANDSPLSFSGLRSDHPFQIAYTLFHLCQMSKSDKCQVCVIPLLRGYHGECFQEIGAINTVLVLRQYGMKLLAS